MTEQYISKSFDYLPRLLQIIASNGFWSVFYFLMVIFFGSFYILNLILAVVALSYQQELANLKNMVKLNQNIFNFLLYKTQSNVFNFLKNIAEFLV